MPSTSWSGSAARGGGDGIGHHGDGLGHAAGDRVGVAVRLDRDRVVAGLRELALQTGREARVLEVVQQVLGLVLEPQHGDLGALLDIGQRHAGYALLGEDRMAVGASVGVADRLKHLLLHRGRHPVLEPLCLLVHLVPGDVEHVGEEALDQAMAADDVLGVLARRCR